MEPEITLQKISVRTKSPRTRAKMGLRNWSVKYRKCVCTPLVLGKVEFPTIWSEFRLKNQLCDGVIYCDDGAVFRIHRAILSAVSPYFRVLLCNYISISEISYDVPISRVVLFVNVTQFQVQLLSKLFNWVSQRVLQR